ncbi:GNAT family N-acetyltransferase [Croceicoccus naphthovorans]|uniref:Phosphinothricin acetyltransferase n=1 Tax=Croceicoccus naphthovorans TaxID=1348774 RepID=A0A0G3XJC7_9SPHN|nr:GNAT family protein [Croceicoccus naphthovorans]AKM11297.1 phosphinothricin acetyltransferase [Croceicoccus naphthovorans]MBB3989780.1 ribosomal-protein-alanine N-acetyltransferase [Croceicoccus naphthovorans]
MATSGQAIDLRSLRAADEGEIVAANRANRAYHAPFVTPCTDAEGFAQWLGVVSQDTNETMIARTPDGAIVGVFNLSQIAHGNFCSAYLGYHGYAETARRGLMTRALRQTVRYAFDTLGLHRIEANIQPDNARSIALVARGGFRKEGYSPRYLKIGGEWRDHERWAITVEDLAR